MDWNHFTTVQWGTNFGVSPSCTFSRWDWNCTHVGRRLKLQRCCWMPVLIQIPRAMMGTLQSPSQLLKETLTFWLFWLNILNWISVPRYSLCITCSEWRGLYSCPYRLLCCIMELPACLVYSEGEHISHAACRDNYKGLLLTNSLDIRPTWSTWNFSGGLNGHSFSCGLVKCWIYPQQSCTRNMRHTVSRIVRHISWMSGQFHGHQINIWFDWTFVGALFEDNNCSAYACTTLISSMRELYCIPFE